MTPFIELMKDERGQQERSTRTMLQEAVDRKHVVYAPMVTMSNTLFAQDVLLS